MIPAALAVLVYQILAILGTEAVSQIVTGIAYRRRDLDFKLMYTQSPLDLLLNYNRFNKKKWQKVTVVLFVCLSIALKFIPTIFTKISSAETIYYNITSTDLDKAQAITRYNWPSTMPVFDNFAYRSETNGDFQAMMDTYISEKLHQNITSNRQGYWFRPKRDFLPFAWDWQQKADAQGFTALDSNGSASVITFEAFGYRNGDSAILSKTTLEGCSSARLDNPVKNITSTHGLNMYGVENYTMACYPFYDPTLSITISNIFPNANISSVLNANDTIYRQVKLSQGTSAMSSFHVSIFNHNSTHMTMGVKKSVHITLYSYNRTVIPPSSCSSSGKSDFARNFDDLPYDALLCDLVTHLNNASLNLSIVQAVGRRWMHNYAINTVYTIQRGNEFERGDSVMIDLTSLQAFTVEGNLKEHKEHLVASESKSIQLDEAQNGPIAIDLSQAINKNFINGKVGSLLTVLGPSYMRPSTVDFLVSMATMKVRYENGDLSDFNLYQADVLDAVRTPLWWSLTVATLVLVFLLPQASRLIVKRIPEYSKDLRSLLLLTIDRTHTYGESKYINNVGIIVNKLSNEADQVALLAVNGYPIAVGEKLDSLDARLLNKEMNGSEEQLTHKR
ncbi:hypothetical protein MBANPS3_011047, partial [Mucor bainieri]